MIIFSFPSMPISTPHDIISIMRIKFLNSKIANQFFFISTLADWHYSVRKEDREAWISMTGQLSSHEEDVLKRFRDLLQTKYGFQSPETYLGEIFYKQNAKEAWKKLEKITGSKKAIFIKDAFRTFEMKFEAAQEKIDRIGLNALAKELKKREVVSFLNEVATLFGNDAAQNETVTIIPLFSPKNGNYTAAGSANLIGNYITIELPALHADTWQMSYSLALVGHEIGHLFFKKRGGKDMIAETMKKMRLKKKYQPLPFETLSLLNEAVTASLVPMGALGQKYFSNTLAKIFFSDLPRGTAAAISVRKNQRTSYYSNLEMYFVWKLFPMAARYLNEKKAIDEVFVKEAASILKDLVKKNSGGR